MATQPRTAATRSAARFSSNQVGRWEVLASSARTRHWWCKERARSSELWRPYRSTSGCETIFSAKDLHGPSGSSSLLEWPPMSSDAVAETSCHGETAVISAVQSALCPGMGVGELSVDSKSTRHGQSRFLSEAISTPSSVLGCKKSETKVVWDSSAGPTLLERAIEGPGTGHGCDRGALSW